jgi:hypothetical protein
VLVVADDDPGLPAGGLRGADLLGPHPPAEVAEPGLRPVLDAEVEPNHAELTKAEGELRGERVGPALADQTKLSLAHASRLEGGAEGLQPGQRGLGPRQQEVVVVEAEHRARSRPAQQQRHLVGDVLGAAVAQGATAAVLTGVAIGGGDRAVAAASPAATAAHDGDEGNAEMPGVPAVAAGEGQAVQIVDKAPAAGPHRPLCPQ